MTDEFRRRLAGVDAALLTPLVRAAVHNEALHVDH